MALFGDRGHSSDGGPGGADVANDEQTDITTRNPETQNADGTANGFLPGNQTRRDSHQSQEPPPPSQFEEELAVTEIRPKEADGDPAGDPMSDLEAYLRGDALRDGDSRQLAESDVHNSLPTTDRPDSVSEEDIESSNMNEPNSIADKDQYTTPNTSHGGSKQASAEHSLSKNEEITALERHTTHMTRTNSAPQIEKRHSKAEHAETPPRDVDDRILRMFNSSQRTRSDVMMDTDPTSAGNSDQTLDGHTEAE